MGMIVRCGAQSPSWGPPALNSVSCASVGHLRHFHCVTASCRYQDNGVKECEGSRDLRLRWCQCHVTLAGQRVTVLMAHGGLNGQGLKIPSDRRAP